MKKIVMRVKEITLHKISFELDDQGMDELEVFLKGEMKHEFAGDFCLNDTGWHREYSLTNFKIDEIEER